MLSCLLVVLCAGLQAAPFSTQQSPGPFRADWAGVWKPLHRERRVWVRNRKTPVLRFFFWGGEVLIDSLCVCVAVRREIDSLNERLAGDGQAIEGGDPSKGALKAKGKFFTWSVVMESTAKLLN